MPSLQCLRADHAPALLAFEQENRAHFAASVPDRGDAYFTEFDARHRALLDEQSTGTLAFHVLVDEGTGEVLGRFNLVDIDPGTGTATLGYRLARKATGRGLATAAVRELCVLAADRHGIRTLHAETTLDNPASRAVLARTGFAPTGEKVLDGRPGLTLVRHSPAVNTPAFAAFRARAEADPRVLGAVLTGSHTCEGMPTEHSDHDVHLVVSDGTEAELTAAEARRDALLDVVVLPLSQFRTHATPGSGTEWNRYAFTHARVLKDTPEGTVSELVHRKGRLTPEEADGTAAALLDAFLNSTCRALGNERDGNPLAARLDATEALPSYLGCLFALHGRVRPYHKYLAWELTHHPLPGPAADRLLPLLTEALDPATATHALRRLLNGLEPLARSAGHGTVLDAWGDDLAFMRGR